ncbi:hypothetical protein BDW22DRAFT_1356062 [Trametopsis cervina]|nr:hypothetical protein BDW22DRAFT_1356062 [Trametopsis cervina]
MLHLRYQYHVDLRGDRTPQSSRLGEEQSLVSMLTLTKSLNHTSYHTKLLQEQLESPLAAKAYDPSRIYATVI